MKKPILKNHIPLSRIKSIHEFFALLEYGMKNENKGSSSVYHSNMGVKPYAFFNHWSIAKIKIAIDHGCFWAVRKKSNNIKALGKALNQQRHDKL